MARRWTTQEEIFYRNQLHQLYIVENRTLGEIAEKLKIKRATVFDRLRRLDIETIPELKPNYCNRRTDIHLPDQSVPLAEFIGIMLGDGHVSHFQTIVTLGSKEVAYVKHVRALMQRLFKVKATICLKKSGYRDIYIGSTLITKWLQKQGLVSNKVAAQVDVPAWIKNDVEYMQAFVRGFFDTDGSVYDLRFGVQISFTNKSAPLLASLQYMLRQLGYKTSKASAYKVYVTKRSDVERFFKQVAPANAKHRRRFDKFMRRWRSGKRAWL